MDPEVEDILAQRTRRAAWGPGAASLFLATLLHLAVAAAVLILPRLSPPPPPLDYVDVQVVPAQMLGVTNPQPRPHPASASAVPTAPPAPPPLQPARQKPEPPRPADMPSAVAREAPVLPVPQLEKPKPDKPKPVKPKPAPEKPDNRFDPTTRPKVVPNPRELLAQRLGPPSPEAQPPAPEQKPVPGQANAEGSPGRPGAATGSVTGKAPVGSSIAGLDNPDFTYDYYIAQLLSLIDHNWTRPPVGAGVRAVISFHIERDGAIAGLAVRETSGFDTFDLAALRAVENAAPFPPLPRGYRHDTLGVNLIVR